ncbi:hypothetical protein BJ944DRAFT_247727 [Cunninghamella echinulata]|nr:hypothetical protein BJ944DRAFT_247727 [Cunninghamella echinulata]
MADFWVTQQKHWCKYCKKYLYNNKATIQKHESGAAHKLQVEQFLSNVYKKGKEDKKEAENIRRELERIEKAANKSMGISTSEEKELSDTAETVKKSIPQTPIKQYSKINANLPPPPSLASLQASSSSKTTQLKGKEEWAIKNEVAMVGQWETVTAQEETKIPSKTTKTEPPSSLQNDKSNNNNNEDDDDEDAQEDLSQFKIKEKEYPIDTFDTPDDNIEDNQNTGSLFKKRKLGQKGNLNTKKKAFRKKD